MERKPFVPTGRRTEAPRVVDQPEPGFFLIRLTRGGPKVAAEIILRDGLWSARIDGQLQGEPSENPITAAGVIKVWTFGERTTESEVRYRESKAAHYRKHDPSHPLANPKQKIDLSKIKPIF